MLRSRLAAGLTLVVLLAVMAGCGYCVHLRSEIDKRDRRIGALSLEKEGLESALVVKPKEVIKLVDRIIPKEVIKVIRESGAEPVASTAVEAVSNPVKLPTQEELDRMFPPKPDETRHTEFKFGVTFGLVIVDIDDESVHYAGNLTGRVFSTDPPWSTNLVFEPENVKVEVAVSDRVKKAMRYANRPWIKKHTSLNCPGVGVGYSLEGQRLTTFVGCTYGFSWF